MAKKKFSNDEVKAIIAEVEQEIDRRLMDGAGLAKAEDDESSPAPHKEPDGDEASASPPADAAPPSPSPEPSAAPASPPPGPDASASPAAPSPEPSAPADPAMEGGGEAPLTPEQLEMEYDQLPDEDFMMHMQAMQASMQKRQAAQAPAAGAPGMGAPPASPPAPPAPAMKAEYGMTKGTGGQVKMGKSEKDLEKEIEDLRKNLAERNDLQKQQDEKIALLTKAVEKHLGQPKRQAVTSVVPQGGSQAAPVELPNLTKAEAVAKLKDKTASGDLSKADRELVNKYVFNQVGIDKIAHLLK